MKRLGRFSGSLQHHVCASMVFFYLPGVCCLSFWRLLISMIGVTWAKTKVFLVTLENLITLKLCRFSKAANECVLFAETVWHPHDSKHSACVWIISFSCWLLNFFLYPMWVEWWQVLGNKLAIHRPDNYRSCKLTSEVTLHDLHSVQLDRLEHKSRGAALELKVWIHVLWLNQWEHSSSLRGWPFNATRITQENDSDLRRGHAAQHRPQAEHSNELQWAPRHSWCLSTTHGPSTEWGDEFRGLDRGSHWWGTEDKLGRGGSQSWPFDSN